MEGSTNGAGPTDDCDHPVQLGGLCAVCGKDLTVYTDFNSEGLSAINRPTSLSISHSTPNLKVTHSEATRLHSTHTSLLHSTKRLTLIVDLDQTVVHATVDPTVGDWMEDLTRPETERRLKGEEGRRNMKEVGRFTLDERGGNGCWYYLKPRPGLARFLELMHAKYEMHVYTMGTRLYANEVCKLIDPLGRYFGDRILSRDESGSLTQKSIERLFPVDNSMVVIIDDRSDVWSSARNLIKVVPYEFFVGTGDINGAFLPKQPSSLTTPTAAPSASSPTTKPPTDTSSNATETGKTEEENEVAHEKELEDVLEERPLQAAMDRAMAESSATKTESGGVLGSGKGAGEEKEGRPDETAASAGQGQEQVASWESLFEDKDLELLRVEKLLSEIHKRYYFALGAKKDPRRPTRPPDVKEIIDRIKSKVLQNVNLVFSGVIPLGVRPESFEWWRMAATFGAVCSHDINGDVTHLIANKPGTHKVYKASLPAFSDRVAIVQPQWLLTTFELWERQPEESFMLELASTTPPPAASTTKGKEEDVGDLGEEAVREIDWGQADRELEEFLESGSEDEEEDEDEGSVIESETVGEDEKEEEEKVSKEDAEPPNPSPVEPKRKRPRPSSVAPSEPDPLFSTDATPIPTRPNSPSSKKPRTTTTPSPPPPSPPKRKPTISPPGLGKKGGWTVSFDERSVKSATSSDAEFGEEDGEESDEDDDDLDDWAKEFAGSMTAEGEEG